MKIRRTRIYIERRRVALVSTRKISATGWCSTCATNVQFVSAETAARHLQLSVRTIYRRAEGGLVHFTETQDGLLLICTASLN